MIQLGTPHDYIISLSQLCVWRTPAASACGQPMCHTISHAKTVQVQTRSAFSMNAVHWHHILRNACSTLQAGGLQSCFAQLQSGECLTAAQRSKSNACR
jgi:hypothetical protein